MRRIVFCLLILLTAFRGMAGDAMAIEMFQMHSGSSQLTIVAAADSQAGNASTPPCHSASEASAEAEHASSECTSCQVCHSPVMQMHTPLLEQASSVAAYSLRATAEWVSAELTHLHKPPVS